MGLTISLIDFSVSCKGEPDAPLASYITLQNLLLLSHAFYAPCLQIKKRLYQHHRDAPNSFSEAVLHVRKGSTVVVRRTAQGVGVDTVELMDGHDCGATSEVHAAMGRASLVARASVEVKTTRGSLSPVASLVCGSATVARTMRGSLSPTVSLMGGTSVVATDSLALVVSLVGGTATVACVGLRGGTAVAGSE
ncbi:unnamed protein product, partial [Ixodes persulcatus]